MDITTPSLTASNHRSRAASSASSSNSSWTLQTPQSPSIMAVLDFGKRGRAGSSPLLGRGHQELFENTLSHRESTLTNSDTILHRGPKESNSSGDRPNPLVSQSFDIASVISHEQFHLHTSSRVIGAGEHSTVGDVGIRSEEDLLDSGNHDGPSRRPMTRTKRTVPSTQALDGTVPDQGDESGAKQGRRIRPRLRAILSAPLTSSQRSSSTTLTKLAGALSSRKPSLESIASHIVNQVSTTRAGTPQTPQLNRFAGSQSEHPVTDDEHTIYMQIPHISHIGASPKSPRSPIPAHRSIPPTLQRGITSPIPSLPQLSDSVAMKTPSPRLDHFERMLPKELKVMILSKLLEDGASQERDRRWSGIVGARRELIRLSRVGQTSSSWMQTG
jgi:hypothetical protein